MTQQEKKGKILGVCPRRRGGTGEVHAGERQYIAATKAAAQQDR